MKTDDVNPHLASIAIPTGPYSGVELSAYWEFKNYRVESSNVPALGRGV